MTPASPQMTTVHSIQFLRFVAAALVAAYHAFHFVDLNVIAMGARLMHFAAAGASGVHIFFVISGFIMVWTSEGKFGKAASIGGFARRRFIRIYPIYWALAAINIVIAAAFHLGFPQSVSDAVGATLLAPGHSSKLIFVGWPLTFELFFYGVFAVLLLLPKRLSVIALSVLFTSLAAIGVLFHPAHPTLHVATNTLLLEFVMGAWIAVIARSDIPLPRWGPPAMAAFGIAGFIGAAIIGPAALPTVISYGVPSALLICGMVLMEKQGRLSKTVKRFTPLGDSSYSLYLVHAMILPPATMLAAGLFGATYWAAFALAIVLTLFCIVFAHGVYLWLERPLIKTVRNFITPRKA
ncbi:acyltransferase family protein [Hyphococcus sp.]|uniref:acyltransferase family protein n=1 Tax=Hyphococcus sp. TaxID=2038636 RepID=UPI0035C75853